MAAAYALREQSRFMISRPSGEIELTKANNSATARALFDPYLLARSKRLLGGIVMRGFNRTAMQYTWLISSPPWAGERFRVR